MDNQGDSTGARKNPLVFNDHVIADKGEHVSLTDFWRSKGSPENKRPEDWRKDSGNVAFVEHVAMVLNTPVEGIWKGTRGKGGGTMAHWQVALAYAKWLDHDIHMWCNTAVREKMEGKALATASGFTEYDKQILGNIVKNCTGVVLREILPAMIDTAIQARVADQSILIRRGETALAVWDRFNLPSGIRGRAQWLGYRLAQFGCALAFGERADIAGRAVRLFDPDKSNFAMKNGLLATARKWAAEKLGQGKLEFDGETK
jgi:hypothetical protein